MKFKRKKKLGQVFLKNNRILRFLSSVLPDIHNQIVIEIGGGLGNLTKYLLKAKKLIVYEIDARMCQILKDKFKEYNNIEIINEDFLKASLKKNKNNYLLIGNIPYFITGKIIRKIFQLDNHPKVAVITLQKEYGEKILGKGGNNFLHSWVKNFAEVKKLIYIKRKNFIPPPNVDSLALKFIFYKHPKIKNLTLFEDYLKNLFKFNNRKIINNLKFKYANVFSKIDDKILNLRAHQLSFDEVVSLFKLIEKRNEKNN